MKRVKVTGDLYHGQIPAGAVYIGRSAPGLPESPFANPHPINRPCRYCHGAEHTRGGSLIAYRREITERLAWEPELYDQFRELADAEAVACWCPSTEKCHGDVLVELVAAAVRPSGLDHDGLCDFDGGCTDVAIWAVAERCSPTRLTGAMLAFYCTQHVGTAPIAAYKSVRAAVETFTGNVWPALLANFPDPVRLL